MACGRDDVRHAEKTDGRRLPFLVFNSFFASSERHKNAIKSYVFLPFVNPSLFFRGSTVNLTPYFIYPFIPLQVPLLLREFESKEFIKSR